MKHAIESLKMNRRERETFFSQEYAAYEESPLFEKQASKEELEIIEARIARLRRNERRRLYACIVGTILLALAGIWWLTGSL